MYKCITILCVAFLFPCVSYAGDISTLLSIGIVSLDNSNIQISTTKATLLGDNILICSPIRKSCSPYRGSDFSSVKTNDAVEDVTSGKSIYSYTTPNRQNLQSEISLALIFHGNEIQPGDVTFDDLHNLIINNKQVRSVVSYCTSSEGVHILSKPGDSHLYYSLGYEVAANCSDEVYK